MYTDWKSQTVLFWHARVWYTADNFNWLKLSALDDDLFTFWNALLNSIWQPLIQHLQLFPFVVSLKPWFKAYHVGTKILKKVHEFTQTLQMPVY